MSKIKNNNDPYKKEKQSKPNQQQKIRTNKPRAPPKSIPGSKAQSNIKRDLIQQMHENITTFRRPTSKLPQLTEPFDSFHSFISSKDANQLYTGVWLCLKKYEDIDLEPHKTSFRLRGRKFIDQSMCEFQIEMHKLSNKHPKHPNKILVEIQRRSGCGWIFETFFTDLMIHFNDAGLVLESKFTLHMEHAKFTPISLTCPNNNEEKETQTSYNNKDLKILLYHMFQGYRDGRRSAATFLANHIEDENMINLLLNVEPNILVKFEKILLNCFDPHVLRAIGYTLYHMLIISNNVKSQAKKLKLKAACQKVLDRFSHQTNVKINNNANDPVRVAPSIQVSLHMEQCIQVLS